MRDLRSSTSTAARTADGTPGGSRTRSTLLAVGLTSAAVALGFGLGLASCGGDDTGNMPVVGCTSDADCTSPFKPWCDSVTQMCANCPSGSSCPNKQTCRKNGAKFDCIEACASSADCLGSASTCCGNTCVALNTAANCGMCGNACAGNMDCISNMCKCPSGSPELCGMKCTDPKTDVANCGSCGKDCGTVKNGYPACTSGKCVVSGCNKGFGNCDGDDTNGCETATSSSVDNCGACGMKCVVGPNADVSCLNGKCSMVCQGDWRSCDNMDDNGCEVNIATDAMHCGGCGISFVCKMGQSCVKGMCL